MLKEEKLVSLYILYCKSFSKIGVLIILQKRLE